MFFHEWNILIVDDEPDVLTVTKLALKDVNVYGLPIKIFTALMGRIEVHSVVGRGTEVRITFPRVVPD